MSDQELDDYLKLLHSKLNSEPIIRTKLEDFIGFIYSYDGDFHVDKKTTAILAEKLSKWGLQSEPKIMRGYTRKNTESLLYIYKIEKEFPHDSSSYRNGLFIARIAVLMASVDGETLGIEVSKIENKINQLSNISSDEKKSLIAKVRYLVDPGLAVEEQERYYKRFALDREKLVEKLIELNDDKAEKVIQILMEIIIADGYIDDKEITLMREIYKALGLPPSSARRDVERYSSTNLQELSDNHKNELEDKLTIDELDELDAVLDSFTDIDDFDFFDEQFREKI